VKASVEETEAPKDAAAKTSAVCFILKRCRSDVYDKFRAKSYYRRELSESSLYGVDLNTIARILSIISGGIISHVDDISYCRVSPR
jgi:hypothetical protein